MRPSIVALGGGHGLAVALNAIREYAGEITAIVSVADDGGSSGRLRRDLDVPAPGDLRRCLVALASDSGPWPAAFEHRFRSGELADHALGNLLLVGLAETLGDLTAALDEAGRLLGAVGRVLPATLGAVSLTARVGDERVAGQVAIAAAGTRDRIHDVRLTPDDPAASPDALAAIARADQIVFAPGSLYTSIVAVLGVPEICAAIEKAPGRVVQIANLQTENETTGHDGTDHLAAVRDHGGRVDQFVYDPDHGLTVDPAAITALGAEPVAAPIAGPGGSGHDPQQLAKALSALL
ncbi:MAG TPA: gluconeogenesis factor YvcK family protein [Acidimicrobiia bacterium]|nr:gluconeogenesis factor YvcK family protein [Acidimicrobiia bacterium]